MAGNSPRNKTRIRTPTLGKTLPEIQNLEVAEVGVVGVSRVAASTEEVEVEVEVEVKVEVEVEVEEVEMEQEEFPEETKLSVTETLWTMNPVQWKHLGLKTLNVTSEWKPLYTTQGCPVNRR